MTNDIPQRFDEAFLRWFRERTEETWRECRTPTFEELVASPERGRGYWQQGTRWLGGVSGQEIATIEQRHHVRFPPDYRLFLQMLHSVDRPQVGARYADDYTMIPVTVPSFYNWQTDTQAIERACEWLVDGLFFDVQHNNFWLQSWGAKPTTPEAQEARVRELVNSAPKLVPVFAHRYLLAEPCEAGNPVLSIYQSDIIVYGVNLHQYFLQEFGGLVVVGGSFEDQFKHLSLEPYRAIPFWGELL